MKYFLSIFLVILILISSAFLTVPAAETDGDPENLITENIMFLKNDEEFNDKKITDNNYYTKIPFEKGDILKIVSDETIHSLYFRFDVEVEEYTLTSGATSQKCGTYGFLHEAIKLDTPSNEITITMPGTKVCDLFVFSEGEFPDFVQQWKPPHDDCDILLFPTHADDEQLFFGSIIPTYASELGYKVQVSYLTRHVLTPERDHELLNGLWLVGQRYYPLLSNENIPDHYSETLKLAKAQYDSDFILEYQVSVLRRFKPEVVIGHDLKGEYGHGAHILNSTLLTEAVNLCGDESAFPESVKDYGTFDVQKLYLHLYEENQIILDAETPLKSFDGKTAMEVAKQGYHEHKSQVRGGPFEYYQQFSLKKFGLYYSTVGSDTGNDIMENTVASDKIDFDLTIDTQALYNGIEQLQQKLNFEKVKDDEPDSSSKLSISSFLHLFALFAIIFIVIFIVLRLTQYKKRKVNVNER